jgi:hypothetical protein
MSEKTYNISGLERDQWRRYALGALGDAGDSIEDVARHAVRAAGIADTMVYLERLRFEANPQPTAYVAPELDEPPITPRSEQRAVIEAEKARIDVAMAGEQLEEGGLLGALRQVADSRVTADLQPEPAPVPEVEP